MESTKIDNQKIRDVCEAEIIESLMAFEKKTGLSVKAIKLDNADGAVNTPFAKIIFTTSL